ncbi:DUF3298/DUF4163 domain-containing protein [bacterium CPR1]|nr:DUF3298/DUF4163 domain-containing protein [bacterium CPR1]
MGRLALLLVLALAGVALARIQVTSPKISETRPRYSIEIVYPRVSVPGNHKATRMINEVLDREAQAQVASFRKDFNESGKEMPAEIPPWSLTSSFTEEYQTDRFLVFLQSGYLYTGGAHGMPLLDAFIFDLASGKRLTMADLYLPGYLDVLSRFTRRKLQADKDLIGEADWVITGTEPKPENFTVVFPTAKGLQVVFPPYQVAAYASGMPRVLVPFSELASLARPGTPTRP